MHRRRPSSAAGPGDGDMAPPRDSRQVKTMYHRDAATQRSSRTWSRSRARIIGSRIFSDPRPGHRPAFVPAVRPDLVAVLVGFVSTCLIASANYTINEWLDAESDRHHPLKHTRPAARGRLSASTILLQHVLLAVTGLWLASTVSGFLPDQQYPADHGHPITSAHFEPRTGPIWTSFQSINNLCVCFSAGLSL